MKPVELAISHLLSTNPFYAHFFLNCEVQYDTKNVPTAGVMITDRNILMIFNSEFLTKLTPKEIGAIIEHEVLHILFEHIVAGKRDKNLQQMIANVAMDCSINQYIRNLPEGCITLERVEEIVKAKLAPKETWEYYYSKIINSPDVAEKLKSLDDHSKWEEGDPSDGTGQMGKVVARAAAEAAMKSAKGIAPNIVQKALDMLKDNSNTPWQQILANFIAKATSSSTKNTRKRTNRRFGIDQPGKVKLRELTLGVCCDSSGSVSDEAYTKFMVEIQRISKYCNKVYIIDADCVVQDVTILKKGQRVDMKRHGNGGTAYQPAITKCLDLKVDAVVYFGDMDSADSPANPRIPFLWAIVGNQNPPANFGGVLRI